MWKIAEVPMMVAKWIRKRRGTNPKEKSISLWVSLKKVPWNMFSWKDLSFITSAVGHRVRIHLKTSACSNFEVAKIFVNADLSKEFLIKIQFSKNGKDFWVDFIHPWLPLRCSTCDKWGHLEAICLGNSKYREKDNQEKYEVVSNVSNEVIHIPEDQLGIASSFY